MNALQLATKETPLPCPANWPGLRQFPALFLTSPSAAKWFIDFFTATIRNRNTRRAYFKARADFRNGARPADSMIWPGSKRCWPRCGCCLTGWW